MTMHTPEECSQALEKIDLVKSKKAVEGNSESTTHTSPSVRMARRLKFSLKKNQMLPRIASI